MSGDWWIVVASYDGGWCIEHRRSGERQFDGSALDRRGAVLAASIRNHPLP